jgi:hypothetical protein
MLPQFFRLIGSDRCLTMAQAEQATQPHPLLPAAWEVYQQHFQEFTGATLDPLVHRLSHPATRVASLDLEPDATMIVVGTGPSLRPNIAGLKRLQGRARIITSPRGAEALLPHGIVPDVVLVEHQTALDAHHSARHLGDCTRNVLASCPLVAADWRTPSVLLTGVADESLFVPAPLPTWGLWPATAVALAVDAGVSRAALLGIDLGSAGMPDPAHAPLAAVLALLARLAPIVALDCGAGGATKRGWMKASIDEAAGATVSGPCELRAGGAPSMAERLRDALGSLNRHAYVVERARVLLAAATAAASGSPRGGTTLEDGAVELMAWRDDADVRVFAQEVLGLSFLPRLWRLGLDASLGPSLWRPLMLATHELVCQADALAAATSTARAA